MQELASRTGGKAYMNTNDLQHAIRDAVTDSEVTYMLGFYPTDEKFDSKFHQIKLEARERSGLNLRYRKGYFDLPELPQDENTRRAGLRDAVWSPIDATAMAVTVEAKPTNTPHLGSVDVFVKVEASSLQLQQQNGRWAGQLDMLFVQKDNRGNQYNGKVETVSLNLLPATYQRLVSEGLVYKHTLDRDRRAKELPVLVRDSASGSIGSVTVPFDEIH